MRTIQLNIRLSGEEARRLEFLAAHYGLNGPGVVRLLLKRDDDAIRPSAAVRRRRTSARQTPETPTASAKCPDPYRNIFDSTLTQGLGTHDDFERIGYAFASRADEAARNNEAAKAALATARRSSDAAVSLFDWMRTFFPGCVQLVPARAASRFIAGIERAIWSK